MKKINCTTVRDLLINDGFINYVLGVESEDSALWDEWVNNNPQLKEIIEQATYVLNAPEDVVIDIYEDEIKNLKSRIYHSLDFDNEE